MAPGEAQVRAEAQALARKGRTSEAVAHLRSVLGQSPEAVGCWLDLATLLHGMGLAAESEAAIDAGLAANADARGLLEAKALVLRLSGDVGRTEAFMTSLLASRGDEAWVHFHLGDLLVGRDADRGERHLRRAVELAPGEADPLFALMQSLERAVGADEGRKLDEAFQLALKARTLGPLTPARHKLLRDVFVRVCAYDALAGLGGFAEVGRAYARAGLHTAFLRQIGQARTPADKQELMEQHRAWGRIVELQAQRSPVQARARAASGDRIRLGFLSSDLRRHPVGYFAAPLFDHPDRDRFELFVYSFNSRPADDLQARISAGATAYHQWPEISTREAAQRIADDGLDMLVELGGSTKLNKIEVLAYRPAPCQASWLGYPHSAGLESIDYFVCDRFNRPRSATGLMEAPLELPSSWITLGEGALSALPLGEPPSARNGHVTFGSANQPHKYGPDVLQAWARIVAATPHSRFVFLRPEAASSAFRRNVQAAFAKEGVAPDRILWRPVRGGHLPYYGEIDISLDAFPLTGGTTTVESLWMGVPVVTLVGDMFHERLSCSILSNVGLADLCAEDVGQYQALAITLAHDLERRRTLRRSLRDTIRAGPLGQAKAFAAGFYDTVQRAVAARRPSDAASA